MAKLNAYEAVVNGLKTTLLLDAKDAKVRGLVSVAERKAAAEAAAGAAAEEAAKKAAADQAAAAEAKKKAGSAPANKSTAPAGNK